MRNLFASDACFLYNLCAAGFTIIRRAKQDEFCFKNRLVLNHSSIIFVSKLILISKKSSVVFDIKYCDSS
jgi:hypothetical protein